MDSFIKDLLDALAQLSALIDHLFDSLCACKNKEPLEFEMIDYF